MALLFVSPVPRAPVLPVAMLMMTHYVSYQSLLLCELHNSLYSLKRGNCSSYFCNQLPTTCNDTRSAVSAQASEA